MTMAWPVVTPATGMLFWTDGFLGLCLCCDVCVRTYRASSLLLPGAQDRFRSTLLFAANVVSQCWPAMHHAVALLQLVRARLPSQRHDTMSLSVVLRHCLSF